MNMTRIRFQARYSRGEWSVRIALVLFSAVLMYFGMSHSLAQMVVSKSPELAWQLAKWDGRNGAALAEWRFAQAPLDDTDAITELAQSAIRTDALALPAVVTLGLQTQLRGETAQARRLFEYAQHLSRRDLRTEIWAIENAVVRGDVRAALRHYDIALRTSKAAPGILYPILATAISDASIRPVLVQTLVGRPAWGQSFLSYAAGSSRDPRSVADFFSQLRRAQVPPPPDAMVNVINALIAQGAVDDAWRQYAGIRPRVNRNVSRDPRFATYVVQPSLLDWVLPENSTVTAEIMQDSGGGSFDFAVSSGGGGPLLQQFQLMRPGLYQLKGRSTGITWNAESSLYWVLTCQDGRELGRVSVLHPRNSNESFSGVLLIPENCPIQILTLVGYSVDVRNASGRITEIELSRANKSQ